MRRFEKVSYAPNDTVIPVRETENSAGYDFCLPCRVVLKPYGFSKVIPTGIKAKMSKDDVLKLYVRSSIGIKKHVSLANGTGIIDADYYDNPKNEGNIGIVLQNNSNRWVYLNKGERIMQGIFSKYYAVYNDTPKGKRTGGFGSTGV